MGGKINTNKLSILSFNTLGTPFFAPLITRRYRKAGEIINKSDFDIVCLQEVFSYYHLYLFKNKLKNFPYAVYQKNPLGPRGGLVIFSKMPLTAPKFTTYSFPKNTFVPFYTKIAQLGFLSAHINSLSLRIGTTHLSSDTVHDLTPENKLYKLIRNQSQEAAKVLNRFSQNESIILAGDFNIAKNSGLYKAFVEATQVIDVFKDDHPTYFPDRVSYFYRAPADRCDFIFTKSPHKKLKTLSTGYTFSQSEMLSNGEKSYLSDHIGLHCILEVNE